MQLLNLKRWRELRGLTQGDLSDLADVSLRAIAGYEAGAEARPRSARKLATALDLDIMDLVGAEASPKAEASPSQGRLFNGISEQQRRALDRIKVFCDQLEAALNEDRVEEPIIATVFRGRIVDLGSMIPALHENESIRPELTPLGLRFVGLARRFERRQEDETPAAEQAAKRTVYQEPDTTENLADVINLNERIQRRAS